jgi:hypothetical protein
VIVVVVVVVVVADCIGRYLSRTGGGGRADQEEVVFIGGGVDAPPLETIACPKITAFPVFPAKTQFQSTYFIGYERSCPTKCEKKSSKGNDKNNGDGNTMNQVNTVIETDMLLNQYLDFNCI